MLRGIEVFQNLSAEERRNIASLCKTHRYFAEQRIVSYQDNTKNVYFVITGAVRATIYSLSGRQVIFQDLEAGQMFGELSAIDGQPRSAHIVALTDTLIASMAPQNFWTVIRTYPCVAEATLKRLTGLVRQLLDKLTEVSTLPVKSRIHAELLRLALQQIGNESNIAILSPAPTHLDIASRIGTHREAVTRELMALKDAGLVIKQGRELIVQDVSRLSNLVRRVAGI